MSWRAIQRTVPQSETLARLDHFEERLYWRLLSQTDPWGLVEGSLSKVRARCVPLLSVTEDEVARALEHLILQRRIEVYIESGVMVCRLLDFDSQQPKQVTRLRNLSGSARLPKRSERSVVVHDISRGFSPELATVASRVNKSVLRTDSDSYPSAVARPLGADALTVSQLADRATAALLAEIRDADDRTEFALKTLRRELPEGSFWRVRDALLARRGRRDRSPLVSEARYVVAALTNEIREAKSA